MNKDNIKTTLCIHYNDIDDDSCPYYKKHGYCNFAHGEKELKSKLNTKNKNNLTINSEIANNTILEVTDTNSSETVITPMTLINEESIDGKLIKTYNSPNSSLFFKIIENI